MTQLEHSVGRATRKPDPRSWKPVRQSQKQSDDFNDDWTRRYSELRLGTEFDLVPVPTVKK
jgi:hypothetical protein